MKNILICERFALEAEVLLKKNKLFNVQHYSESSREKLANAHALIIRSKFKIDETLLEKTKNLELIVTCTSGFDHIDLKATKNKNICVMYTPDANAISAAEHTWALLMAAQRQLVEAHKHIKSGGWQREFFVTNELAGKTLGIVGLGRIGQKVAHIAKAFQMKLVIFDPYQNDEVFKSLSLQRSSYEEVLKQSDFLSFHVPSTFETKNMLSRSQLEYVNPDLILINTSRGDVINEDDLAEALLNKKIKFAALDVFTKEPLNRESKLMKCSNILLTPHLGAMTEEAFSRASLEATTRLVDFFEHNKSENTLPLVNDWGSLSFAERT